MAMNLTPQIENEITMRMASGNYADTDEMLIKAMDLLAREEQVIWLRKKIDKSLNSPAREWTSEETLADFQARKIKRDSEDNPKF